MSETVGGNGQKRAEKMAVRARTPDRIFRQTEKGRW